MWFVVFSFFKKITWIPSIRNKEIIIPKSDFKFEKKDLVVFLTKREHLEKVESLFRISSLV